jgi:eukaryotic-like serine/threonine-protein kinase
MTDSGPDRVSPSDLWQRADALFTRALELPAAERARFVDRACSTDEALRERVDRLLRSVGDTEDFLEHPSLVLGAELEALFTDGHAADEESEPGLRLGPYELVRRIGRGGSGSVYLARRADGVFEQTVAVKILRRGLDTEDVLRRFGAERQILASLEHPGIARLIDGGVTPEHRPYMVMEYVDGVAITDYCDARRLTVRQRLDIFDRVAQVVDHAHRNLVVHRDIKPSNILVTAAGEPKLLDFGIAKLFEPGVAADLTVTSSRVMTPAFASPEQLAGGQITTATDIYQLGMLLYVLLTGHRPFTAATSPTSAAPRAHTGAEPERPSSIVTRTAGSTASDDSTAWRIASQRDTEPRRLKRELRGDLDTIVMTCLREDPAQRYGSVAALVADLRRFLGNHPIHARAPSVPYRVRRFVVRRPGVIAAAAVALLAGTTYVGSLRAYAQRLQLERDRAHTEERRATHVSQFLVDLFAVPQAAGAVGDTLTARALLESGVARIRTELHDDPLTRSALLLSFGRAYGNLGAGGPALDLIGESLQLHTELHGEADPRTIMVLEQLAQSRVAARHDTEARQLLQRAIALRRAQVPVDSAALYSNLRSLAFVMRDLGQPDSALAVLDEAIATSRHVRDDAARAIDLHDRARILNTIGDSDAAGDAFNEALELFRSARIEDDDPFILLLQHYAIHLRRAGQPAQAEPLQLEALERQRARHGRFAPLTLQLMQNRARVLSDLARHDEAEALLVEIVDARTAVWQPGSWQVGDALGELGAHHYDRGDYVAATASFRMAAQSYVDALGADHPYVGHGRVWIGRALLRQGRYAEAEVELRAGIAMLEASDHDAARRWLPGARAALAELDEARSRPDAGGVHR